MKLLIAALAMLGMVASATALDPAPAAAGVVVRVGVHPVHHWRGHRGIVVRVHPVRHRWRYTWRGGHYNYFWGGHYYMNRYYCVRHRHRIWCYR